MTPKIDPECNIMKKLELSSRLHESFKIAAGEGLEMASLGSLILDPFSRCIF